MTLVLLVREQKHAFGKPCLCPTPAIFVVSTGSEQQSPCFTGYRTQIRYFRRFRRNPLLLAGDNPGPVLLFLVVFGSLVFFLARNFLDLLGVFCLFSKVFRGSQVEK